MQLEPVNILDLLAKAGESFVDTCLSTFQCEKNPEIEHYLRHNALNFARKGISITYLVLCTSGSTSHLLGYYSITYKILRIRQGTISRTAERKLARFGELDNSDSSYSLPAPLIAQFGKNSAMPLALSSLLTGNILMTLALNQIKLIHHMVGGRVVLLECEDNPFLLDFYARNGFTVYSKRYTNNTWESPFYHQLFKFVK